MNRVALTRFPLIKSLLRSRWPQLVLRCPHSGHISAGDPGRDPGHAGGQPQFRHRPGLDRLVGVAGTAGRARCSGAAGAASAPSPCPASGCSRARCSSRGERPGSWAGAGPIPCAISGCKTALSSCWRSSAPSSSPSQRFPPGCWRRFLLVAIGASLVFERRAFCRYLCPVGGFIGLYSQSAPLELRVVDASVCASHTEKTCYTGSSQGYGCPWQVFPGGLGQEHQLRPVHGMPAHLPAR